MPPAFDTRQLPSLRNVGATPGSSAGKTERYNRGVTQGARWQYDLNKLKEDQAMQERQFAEKQHQFDASQRIRMSESDKARTSAEKLAAWNIGLGLRGQDASAIKTLISGQGIGKGGTRGSGGGAGIDATMSKVDISKIGKLDDELAELRKALRNPELEEGSPEQKKILDDLTKIQASRNNIYNKYQPTEQSGQRGVTIRTATGQDLRIGPDGVPTFATGETETEAPKKGKKPKLPRLKGGEIRLASGDIRKKGDLSAFAGKEGRYGTKNGVAGMWFGNDFVGRNELREAGYQFDTTEDARGMETPAGGSFLTRKGKQGEDILRPRTGTLAGLRQAQTPAPAVASESPVAVEAATDGQPADIWGGKEVAKQLGLSSPAPTRSGTSPEQALIALGVAPEIAKALPAEQIPTILNEIAQSPKTLFKAARSRLTTKPTMDTVPETLLGPHTATLLKYLDRTFKK